MFSSLKSLSSNISTNYQIAPHSTVISGPWRIHDGKKKSTGTAASIFIFDRKLLEPRSSGLGGRSSSSTKKAQEDVVERLKREASNLARLRHPSILQVLEPIEETRNGGLMFATEQLTTSLAGLLKEKDAQEGSSRHGARSSRFTVEETDGGQGRRDLDIDELEIQKGLLQVAKGLEFLHGSAGLVHGNLNPEAIYINSKSDWKISGLGFAGPSDPNETRTSLPPLALSEVLHQDPRLPPSVQLNLDFTSPDFALDSNVSPSADLFSLGLVIVALYNSPHASPLQTHSSVNSYKKLLSSPSTTPSQGNNFLCSGSIPNDLLTHVLPRLITRRPAQRLDAREFQQSPYFDNILVSTLRFLESLPAKTPSEKSQFMRGLQRVLPEFPVSVLDRKLLGVLLEEMKDRELLSLILQNVFAILQRIPNARRTFPERVIPRLKEVFPTGKGAVQDRDSKREAGLMVVLENMNIVAENCPGKEFKDDILPLIRLAMDSPTHSLADAAIKCLPIFLPTLDFSTVKTEVFPPIAATFSKTNSLGIKVSCLEAFTVLCGGSKDGEDVAEDDLTGIIPKGKPQPTRSSILDKYTIQEKLVPSLKAIKTKEPAVMMAALGVFQQVGKVADTDFIALEILPVIWSFSLGPLLNLRQFEQFMALIKNLSSKIEREHTKKLKELSSGGDSGGFQNGTGSSSKTPDAFMAMDTDPTRNNFERLVLGRGSTASKGQDLDNWGSLMAEAPAAQPSTSRPSSTALSWSSQPARPNAMGSALSSQPNPSMRSITPDFNMGSFPSLQPAAAQKSPATSAFPPLQPSPSPSWSAMNSPNNQYTSPASNLPSPGLGSMASMKPSNSSFAGNLSRPTTNFSAFSIPPPPSTQGSMGSFSGSSGLSNAPMVPPPPPSTQGSMGSFAGTGGLSNAPMASPGRTNPSSPFQGNTNNSSQPQGGAKKGLDKYESLI
ncbi:kinase-like protein [Aspergillus campestris IBT 28561]|uniref:Kinase-like protein n=1 Tax=Aspergillus campestris (strain IBT 28561) TaxID=1392248 RepID=A0A2I1CW71_ASPC2|nr:kinase-like protein [Aspergillus campestris IBT 28561]PKY01871.1 kinase-like protein [Aspergillus campestris IBT 28561]